MKKVKLKVDELRVESFETRGGGNGRGTVRGQSGIITDWHCSPGTGCNTDDGCCGANTYGDACGTSGLCDDISACWGNMC